MNKRISEMLNKQMNQELYAAFVYRNMASLAAKQGMKGFSKWLNIQFKEEMSHSNLIYQYMTARNQFPQIHPVKDPVCKAKHFSEIPQEGLKLEKITTDCINAILDEATKEKEYATIQFLQLFVNEQVEEIQLFDELIDSFNLISDKNYFVLDVELGKRNYGDPKINIEL